MRNDNEGDPGAPSWQEAWLEDLCQTQQLQEGLGSQQNSRVKGAASWSSVPSFPSKAPSVTFPLYGLAEPRPGSANPPCLKHS